MKRYLILFVLLVCARGVLGEAAGADTSGRVITVPAEQAQVPGDIEIRPDAIGGTYQQVFDASLFSFLPPSGGWVAAIEFRNTPVTAAKQSGFVSGITIGYSTTTKGVDSLSPIFAENIGHDSKIVYTPDKSTFFAPLMDLHPYIPAPFIPTFISDGKGFFYDPRMGNLVLTMTGFHVPDGNFGRYKFDGVRGSSLTSAVISADPSAVSGQLTTDVLVSRIYVGFEVPEPTSWGLVLLAGVGFYLRKHRHSGLRLVLLTSETQSNDPHRRC